MIKSIGDFRCVCQGLSNGLLYANLARGWWAVLCWGHRWNKRALCASLSHVPLTDRHRPWESSFILVHSYWRTQNNGEHQAMSLLI